MITVKTYSIQEALKRLHNDEILQNINLGLEIEDNGKPGNRKTSFDDDIIIVSKEGEYCNGFNYDFINEYIRNGKMDENLKILNENLQKGILKHHKVNRLFNQIHDFDKIFKHIHSKIEPSYRQMTQFEMMGWANSDDSKGWLVRYKSKGEKIYSPWLLPQRFDYAGVEKFHGNSAMVIYERAKLLPDHSNIDKSTITDFKVTDTDYQFYQIPDKKQKQREAGFER